MSERGATSLKALWWRNGLLWLALMLLLALTLVLAYVPMGIFTTVAGLAIAAVKAVIVVSLFMQLASAQPLIRLAALAGLLFLLVLFVLTFADILARA